MKHKFSHSTLIAALVLAAITIQAQPVHPDHPSSTNEPIAVTVENFSRAETDRVFGSIEKQGGFGKFNPYRELTPLNKQIVPRGNRDTLYSPAVFDLDAGPVTITLPDAGKRFMSMIVIDEDHYVYGVFYGPGSHTLTREKIGTRYAFVAIRILVNPAIPKDVAEVHALQDAVKVSQKSAGNFEMPDWDQVSQKNLRNALAVLGATMPDLRKAFGTRDQVDPMRHLIASATAWGGNPDKDAIYLNITPHKNDGTTIYRLTVKDVPVDAFWSISVYNSEGFFQQNEFGAYSLNNLTAKKNEDGSVSIQFGGCVGNSPNCLPIMPGWNYMVRLYHPRAEILDGTWKFPEAQPVR